MKDDSYLEMFPYVRTREVTVSNVLIASDENFEAQR
jgi:hypothetical protein